jgi:hypothetical protein
MKQSSKKYQGNIISVLVDLDEQQMNFFFFFFFVGLWSQSADKLTSNK